MILDEIAAAAKQRVIESKNKISLETIRAVARALPKGGLVFETALKKPGVSFICEVKKASPSKGVIAQEFPFADIAREYEAAGAAAVSVLTEPFFFKGSDDYLTQIKKEIKIPVLRKDFTVDEYQLYEAKVMGADAVLLIGALLDKDTIKEYLSVCDELSLSALVEVHDERQAAAAVEAGARIIGVNNRDLKTFEVDIQNSVRLSTLIPKDRIFVAESGITNAEDILMLEKAGCDAVLIGETLMRAKDKQAKLAELGGR